MTESGSDDYLSDADASVVLDRASELSVRREGQVGVAELRSIAEEAGIPPEVFDRALADIRSAPLAVSEIESSVAAKRGSPPLVPSRWRLGVAALGVSFAALGSGLPVAFGIDPDVTVLFAMILACLSAAGLISFRHPRREILEFEFDLASLWVGLTLAWMIFDPAHAPDVLATTGVFAGIAGGLGAILIARSDVERSTALPRDPDGDASPEERSRRIPGGDSL